LRARKKIAGPWSTLAAMPRKRLTLEDLVAARMFNPRNFRHRRALDESGPLDDRELEEARRALVSYRRWRKASEATAGEPEQPIVPTDKRVFTPDENGSLTYRPKGIRWKTYGDRPPLAQPSPLAQASLMASG
jgi:hypothetical protein